MKYSDSQIWTIARSMKSGIHSSFAAHIGEAFMVADSGNRKTLLKAFSGLFDSVAKFNNIEPKLDEAKHEAFIERLIDRVDKRLMQGYITQAEYEVMMSTLLKDATP